MARFGVAAGPVKAPDNAVLPHEFDETTVADFFGSKPLGADHPAIPVLNTLIAKRFGTEDDIILDDGPAGARPEGKGKGGSSDGGTKGGGKGKNKDTTDDGGSTDPGTTEPTDPVPTDPEPTDPTPTDPEPTDPTPTDPSTSTADYVSGLDTPNGYNIEIDYVGNWTDSQKAALEAAAEQISDMILSDLPAVGDIDDLRISANMVTIDGGGGTWGWGGTTASRADSKLPYSGYIRIDSADAASVEGYGLFQDLVFHEMLHAMGFGTSWWSMGLLEDVTGTGDWRFTGDYATQIYNSQYTTIAGADGNSHLGVPVETDGGSGAAGKHWDEETFGTDIMSTRLGWTNEVSDLTIAALQDMGYETVLVDEFMLG